MSTLLFVLGLVLLLVLMADVHSTVFIPRGDAGLISRRLYLASWTLWKRIGDRLPSERRRRFLAHLGPALVPVTVTLWAAMLVASFGLMYAPWASDFNISPPESGPMPRWAITLYYSWYSAVTLGVGDVVPSGTTPRLMAVLEAGFGFALFTVAVAYLLSVYNARNESATLALAISRFMGRRDGQDPVSLLVAVVRSDTEQSLAGWLGTMAHELSSLVQIRGQYPLLHYFHEPNDDRALPVSLSDLLELTTLCRSMLDPQRYPTLALGPTVVAVERIGRHYLAEFDITGLRDDQQLETWRRQRFTEARKRMADAGVALRAEEEAWQRYRDISREWDVADEHIRDWMGYRSIGDPARA